VDDFIRCTQINGNPEVEMLEFVPYNQFKDIEFIAESGFSKVYKATWINGYCIRCWNKGRLNFKRSGSSTVILKKLDNSQNITSKEV